MSQQSGKNYINLLNKNVLQSSETTRQVENNSDIRVKFDALPSPEVSSAEVGMIPKGQGHNGSA